MAEEIVKIHVLPGGTLPKRQSNGAVGYDVHLRAIVSPHEIDEKNPRLRKTLFDFRKIPSDPKIAERVEKKSFVLDTTDEGVCVWRGTDLPA